MEIKTYSHDENWKICNELAGKGFYKIFDCLWSKKFYNPKTRETVFVKFER